MNLTIALLLAANLINGGKPAKVVNVGKDQAVVIIEGRPGCYGKAMNGDPSTPVVVCDKAKKR